MLATEPAISAVRAAFAALERGDWAGVADLTAPDTIERERRHDLAFLLAWADYTANYATRKQNGYGSSDDIKPELLARYGGTRLDWFDGTPTIAELAALPPQDFFARWLRHAHDQRSHPGLPVTKSPRCILGAVADGERFVHVVYRGVGWIPIEQVQIMPVVIVDGRCLLAQNRDVLRMAMLPNPGA